MRTLNCASVIPKRGKNARPACSSRWYVQTSERRAAYLRLAKERFSEISRARVVRAESRGLGMLCPADNMWAYDMHTYYPLSNALSRMAGMNPSCRLACAAACLFLSPVGDTLAGPTVGSCPIFPASNYWNTPVDGLPLHASSAIWVNSIGAAAKLHPDWGNVLADNFGIPFATVTGRQPKVPITFPPDGYSDESDPGTFPIPPSAPIEGGSGSDGDRHVIVVDTTSCMLYELYNAFP